MGSARRVILVGCGQRKLTNAAPARELYTGPLFRDQRAYAEASGQPWAILSARYGLVLPAAVIEPYDQRLPKAFAERHYWAEDVYPHVRPLLPPLCALVEILAGGGYVEALRPVLQAHGLAVREPLAGLALGPRRRRLAQMATAERQAAQEVSRG